MSDSRSFMAVKEKVEHQWYIVDATDNPWVALRHRLPRSSWGRTSPPTPPTLTAAILS